MKPDFNTAPNEWVEAESMAVRFAAASGREVVFHEHRELNRETGEVEPAHPPAQPWADTAEVRDTNNGVAIEEVTLPDENIT